MTGCRNVHPGTPPSAGPRRKNRRELNLAEQANILRAHDWVSARRRDLLTKKFFKDLHRQVLGHVWRWAGRFRTTERNIGIRFYDIPMAVRTLCDDARTWIAHAT